MKKALTLMVALLLLVTAIPFATASTETGVGQDRVVTFNDPYQYTNTTVAVPVAVNNETNLVYMFVVTDESNITCDYTFNVTIMSNGTYYNGSVNIMSVDLNETHGFVNFTALSLPLNSTANITITMLYTLDYTVADVWYGTISVMTANDYTMTVVFSNIIINLMTLFIMVVFVLFVVKILRDSIKSTTKKGKK